MGTGGLIRIRNAGDLFVVLRVQRDGYPTGIGKILSDFFDNVIIVNWYTDEMKRKHQATIFTELLGRLLRFREFILNPDISRENLEYNGKRYANGIECLVPQLICHLKHDNIGNIYMLPAVGSENYVDEYVYDIDLHDGEPTFKINDGEEMNLEQFGKATLRDDENTINEDCRSR